jgi:hypothetical protein
MEQIQKAKKEILYKDKDFITKNIDKAQVWREINQFNLNLQQVEGYIE